MHHRPVLAALVAVGLTGLALPPSAGAAGAVTSKEKKVRQLLELTDAKALSDQMLEQVLQGLDKTSGLPPGFGSKFRELAQQDDYLSRLVPIYMKHLNEADLDGAIRFYQTPAGKNFIKAQPALLSESMEIGQAWGQDLAQKTCLALNLTADCQPKAAPGKP